MAIRTVDRPGDRIADKDLLAAFKDALEAAKRSEADVVIRRAGNDYDVYRWVDGAWECRTTVRPGPFGCATFLGFGA
jgi:hypothetical protein